MKRWLVGLALLLVLLGASAVYQLRPRRGPLTEEHILDLGTSVVRERLYGETNTIVPGSYFEIESRPRGDNRWHHLLTFRHDEGPWDRSLFTMRRVGDRVAYLHVGWVYAVTEDGGRNWSVWDASEDLAGWECCNYRLINRVELEESGTGRMYLKPIENPNGITPVLRTRDHGATWEWLEGRMARSLR